MNRLIIIGNGFDLAHGLKTSCKHFILSYLNEVWAKLSSGNYEDRLIRVINAKEYFRENDLTFNDEKAFSIFKKIDRENSSYKGDASLEIKSKFFSSIFHKTSTLNWADFETEYFNELYYLVEISNKRKNKNIRYDRVSLEASKYSAVKSLNDDLEFLKTKLIKYLSTQENIFRERGNINLVYKEYFKETILEGEVVGAKSELRPKEIYFLNFNYTNTLKSYMNGSGSEINYIHGTLKNNPIFGFGDDTSEKYAELENEYINEILKKIKSFKYLNNSNYNNLIRFINKDSFQIHIYGHSCGVSDRTLFKQIFENQNCRFIKIFYHNEADFDEKKYEISRHFQNKAAFLQKVVPFDRLREMPQALDEYE